MLALSQARILIIIVSDNIIIVTSNLATNSLHSNMLLCLTFHPRTVTVPQASGESRELQ